MNSGEVCGGGEGVRAEPADLSGGWVGSSSSGWRKQVDSRRPGHKSFFFTKSLAGMTAGCHMATSLSLSLAVMLLLLSSSSSSSSSSSPPFPDGAAPYVTLLSFDRSKLVEPVREREPLSLSLYVTFAVSLAGLSSFVMSRLSIAVKQNLLAFRCEQNDKSAMWAH